MWPFLNPDGCHSQMSGEAGSESGTALGQEPQTALLQSMTWVALLPLDLLLVAG